MMKLSALKTRNSYIKSIIWSFVILLSCILPANKISKIGVLGIKHIDKLFHFLMYFIFSLILFFDLHKNVNALKNKYSVYLFILFIPFVWGIIIELIQYYLLVNREGSIADIMANISGIFAGILLILIAGKYFLKN